MKTNRLAASLPALSAVLVLWLLCPAQGADIEKNLDHTFTVTPGGKLVLEADRGSVAVAVGGDTTVQVKVFRKVSGSNSRKAEEILAAHEVTFQQEGNQAIVKARNSKSSNGWSRLWNSLSVRYEVAVPRQFSARIHTAGGSITVADLSGEVDAHTAGGSIKLGRIEGAVQAKTAGGGIEIASATGVIDAETAGGSVTIREAGASVKAETAGGSIHLGKVRGAVDAQTAGGGITIEQANGRIAATTSGGSIKAGLAGSPEEDCRLETAAGSIELRMPANVSADVDARTSAGSVTCDLPVTTQGAVKSSMLQGKLGAGGRLLKLRTSAGSIHLKAI